MHRNGEDTGQGAKAEGIHEHQREDQLGDRAGDF